MSDPYDDYEQEPEEYASFEDAFAAGIREGRRLTEAEAWRKSVEQLIDDMSWVHQDPTGQDADSPEYTRLFDELIEARDHELKEKDPDRYAEMKHFEAAARYLP